MRIGRRVLLTVGVFLFLLTTGGLITRHRWSVNRHEARRCQAKASKMREKARVWESLAENERQSLTKVSDPAQMLELLSGEDRERLTKDVEKSIKDDVALVAIFFDDKVNDERATRTFFKAAIDEERRECEKLLNEAMETFAREQNLSPDDPRFQAERKKIEEALEKAMGASEEEAIEDAVRDHQGDMAESRREMASFTKWTKASIQRHIEKANEDRQKANALDRRKDDLLRRWW